MTPDFPYDMEAIFASMLKHARKHSLLCREEIVSLRVENEMLKAELIKLKYENPEPLKTEGVVDKKIVHLQGV